MSHFFKVFFITVIQSLTWDALILFSTSMSFPPNMTDPHLSRDTGPGSCHLGLGVSEQKKQKQAALSQSKQKAFLFYVDGLWNFQVLPS